MGAVADATLHMGCCLICVLCLALPSCRYDCIWIQWCLLYLTDGEHLAGPLQSLTGSLCVAAVMLHVPQVMRMVEQQSHMQAAQVV
jgi:hypothetical protein